MHRAHFLEPALNLRVPWGLRLTRRGTWLASEVLLAETSRARRRGLIGQTGLAPGRALVIAPSQGIHTFGMAFGVLGATVGVAIRDFSIVGILLAIGVLGIGSLGVVAVVLLWRSFCEFYVTIFKISEDLAVLRADVEAERARQGK